LVGSALPDFDYAGYYYHSRSKLNMTATRAYSGALSRWINRDSLEESGGNNLYGYVRNNPISFVDPLGLDPSIDQQQLQTAVQAGTAVGMGIGGFLGATGGGLGGGLASGGTLAIPAGAAGATMGASLGGGIGGLAAGGANLAAQYMNAMGGSSQGSGNFEKNKQGNNICKKKQARDALKQMAKQLGMDAPTAADFKAFEMQITGQGTPSFTELLEAASDYYGG
jgi:RHS repeat-associated protein